VEQWKQIEEEKCRAHKPTREKIGEKYPNLLPYGGLFKREWSGRKNWYGKTPEEQNCLVEHGAKTENWPKSGIPEHV
jgi:hypothetical protein